MAAQRTNRDGASLYGRPKYLLLSIALSLLVVTTRPACAQSLEELQAQIKALQKRIEQLEAAQRKTTSAPAVKPAQVGASAKEPRVARTRTTELRQTGPVTAQRAAAQEAAKQAQAAAAQAQQAAERAQLEATQATAKADAEVKAATAPPSGKPGLSFTVPGTATLVRPYGFIKMTGITDFNTQDQSDTLTAQSIPLANTAAQRTGGGTQFTARRSRIGFETWTPEVDDFGEFHTLVEMDFEGQNTNLTTQATSNSYTPRLRKAYADFGLSTGGWGAVLFGQTDTLFSDKALLQYETMSGGTFVGESGVRQGQFRYTYGFRDGVSLAFAVEAPYSDITTTVGTSYPDSNGGGGFGWQKAPDLTGRVLLNQDWGILALRGLLRPQIDLNNEGATSVPSQFNKSVTGYGVGATAVVKLLGGGLVLMASGNAGDGLGRYLDTTANGFGAVSNFGLPGVTATNASVNAVSVYGGMVGAQYFFTPTLRTNMALGGARIGLPNYVDQFGGCVGSPSADGTCSSVNSSEWTGTVNLVWSPFKMIDIGLEYQHVERKLQQRAVTGTDETASGGNENRLLLTTFGRF